MQLDLGSDVAFIVAIKLIARGDASLTQSQNLSVYLSSDPSILVAGSILCQSNVTFDSLGSDHLVLCPIASTARDVTVVKNTGSSTGILALQEITPLLNGRVHSTVLLLVTLSGCVVVDACAGAGYGIGKAFDGDATSLTATLDSTAGANHYAHIAMESSLTTEFWVDVQFQLAKAAQNSDVLAGSGQYYSPSNTASDYTTNTWECRRIPSSLASTTGDGSAAIFHCAAPPEGIATEYIIISSYYAVVGYLRLREVRMYTYASGE